MKTTRLTTLMLYAAIGFGLTPVAVVLTVLLIELLPIGAMWLTGAP